MRNNDRRGAKINAERKWLAEMEVWRVPREKFFPLWANPNSTFGERSNVRLCIQPVPRAAHLHREQLAKIQIDFMGIDGEFIGRA
jgi:hypothetical protein